MVVPVVGLGTAPGGSGLSDTEAMRLHRTAIDMGVTYLDTAPGYKRAQTQLAKVLKGRRSEVIIATKVATSEGEAFRDGLESNLRDLGTDFVDIAYIHSLGSQDADELLSEEGSLSALLAAKEAGLARYVGFTAHNRPGVSERVLQFCPDLDVVMLAMNFVDRSVYGFEDRVLPLAIEQNLGVAAMKVFGGAYEMKYSSPTPSHMRAKGGYDHHGAFRYALSLPGVAISVIGMFTEQELRQNIDWACEFDPVSAAEMNDLVEDGRAAGWGEHYGPVE